MDKVYYDSIEEGTADSSNDPSKKAMKNRIFWIGLPVLALLALIFYSVFFAVQFFNIGYIKVNGSSMSPTFEDNDGVLISTREEEPQRGDVTVFMTPDSWVESGHVYGGPRFFVKRAVGIPGDTVEMSQYGVSVNGEQIVDNSVLGIDCWQDEEKIMLDESSYLLLGDNHQFSNDAYRIYCSGMDAEDIVISEELLYSHGTPIFIADGGWSWLENQDEDEVADRAE